ncbi:MAG: amino acid ABC transporter permease [Lachnospiraceae bacterium]|nr:amino acid ABC transporter permease [Lachnospiraceae bacterium]
MRVDLEFIRQALPDIAKFIPVTLLLVVVSFFLSFPAGALFAWINYKKIRGLSPLVRAYMSLIRGTPVILQIYVIYNVTPYLLASLLERMGSSLNVYRLNTIWYAFFALSLSSTVTIAEALRAGMETVGRGQFEGGLSVGMSGPQTMWHIVFPQALTAAMPVMGNVVVELTKATSLAFTMAVTEITGRAKILGGSVLRYFEAYICVFLLYIVIIALLEQLFKHFEKRISVYRTGRHSRAKA